MKRGEIRAFDPPGQIGAGLRTAHSCQSGYNQVMRTTKPAATDQPPSRRTRQSGRERLRPVRIWIPDVEASGFPAEAHRQSLAVAASEDAREDQHFVDAISDPA